MLLVLNRKSDFPKQRYGTLVMEVQIEFYRTRDRDKAHAVLGRVTKDATDLEEAIEIAQSLSRSLAMPQRPDAVTISDATGKKLYSCEFGDGPEK